MKLQWDHSFWKKTGIKSELSLSGLVLALIHIRLCQDTVNKYLNINSISWHNCKHNYAQNELNRLKKLYLAWFSLCVRNLSFSLTCSPYFMFSCQLLDMKIFVDTDSDIRLVRRLRRDITERGRDIEGVIKQYNKFVKPAFEQYIEPTMRLADIVVPRGECKQHTHTFTFVYRSNINLQILLYSQYRKEWTQ